MLLSVPFLKSIVNIQLKYYNKPLFLSTKVSGDVMGKGRFLIATSIKQFTMMLISFESTDPNISFIQFNVVKMFLAWDNDFFHVI